MFSPSHSSSVRNKYGMFKTVTTMKSSYNTFHEEGESKSLTNAGTPETRYTKRKFIFALALAGAFLVGFVSHSGVGMSNESMTSQLVDSKEVVSGNWAQIKLIGTKLCIDMPGGDDPKPFPGIELWLWDCDTKYNKVWKKSGNMIVYKYLDTSNREYCMDCNGSDGKCWEENGRISLWPCDKKNGHQKLLHNTFGHNSLAYIESFGPQSVPMCIDATSDHSNGSYLQSWECDYPENQSWRIKY